MTTTLIRNIAATLILSLTLIVAMFFAVQAGMSQYDAASEQRVESLEPVKQIKPIVAADDSPLHAAEPHVFPNPCELESVLCEGEEGWTPPPVE